jgi:hypothetical protein
VVLVGAELCPSLHKIRLKATHEEGAVLEATSTSSNPQTHDRAECAVGRIVIGEIAEIPGKQRGNSKPRERGKDAAYTTSATSPAGDLRT